MAKLYNGDKLFPLVIKPTGNQPLDDRTVVQSFNDLIDENTFMVDGSKVAYSGMLVAVVDDQQVYMLINENETTKTESWIAVGSGNGTITVDTYEEAVEIASAETLGQFIFVKGENLAYVVIGEDTLMKLASSTAGNIDDVVNGLQARVAALETNVEGLAETVNGIKYPVTDVKVDGESILDADGVAQLSDLATNSAVDGKIQDAFNAFATDLSNDNVVNTYKELIDYAAAHGAEFTELVGEVDKKIENVEVNGVDATISGKTASVKINAEDIEIGVPITDGSTDIHAANAKISTVLQSIQDSITVAQAGSYAGVVPGNGINAELTASKTQHTISVKLANTDGNLLSVDGNGLFAAMYYDGDDEYVE